MYIYHCYMLWLDKICLVVPVYIYIRIYIISISLHWFYNRCNKLVSVPRYIMKAYYCMRFRFVLCQDKSHYCIRVYTVQSITKGIRLISINICLERQFFFFKISKSHRNSLIPTHLLFIYGYISDYDNFV